MEFCLNWRAVAGKNVELLEKMETLFNVWHSQIEQVLTEHEQIRREADNIGPDVELQYWKNRMDKFHMYASSPYRPNTRDGHKFVFSYRTHPISAA